MIREYAQDKKIPYVDYHSVMKEIMLKAIN